MARKNSWKKGNFVIVTLLQIGYKHLFSLLHGSFFFFLMLFYCQCVFFLRETYRKLSFCPPPHVEAPRLEGTGLYWVSELRHLTLLNPRAGVRRGRHSTAQSRASFCGGERVWLHSLTRPVCLDAPLRRTTSVSKQLTGNQKDMRHI